jgi:hypothetical protein
LISNIQVVRAMLKQETTKLNNDLQNELLYVALIQVHHAHKTLSPKLRYFREINHVWQGCSTAILRIPELQDTRNLKRKLCTDRVSIFYI